MSAFESSLRIAIALALAAIAGGGIAAASQEACKAIAGTVEPNCNGAICNQGRFTGDLSGSFTSRVTSIYPWGAAWQFTGWTRIELDQKRGTLETLDEGTTPKDARGGPDMANAAETLRLSDASGALQDYIGTIRIDAGRAVGKRVRYAGSLCKR